MLVTYARGGAGAKTGNDAGAPTIERLDRYMIVHII